MVKNPNDRPQKNAASRPKAAPKILPPGYERGVLKKFFDTHGFILPDNGGPDVFVHINDIGPGVNTLRPNQRVIFKRGPGLKKYSIQAYDVRGETEGQDRGNSTRR